MLWVHPVIQLFGTLFAVIALRYGWRRFCAVHLGKKCVFQWKDHVQWGQLAQLFWFGGLLLGLWAAHWTWFGFGVTGAHFWIGLGMGCLMVVSFSSGMILDRIKKRRKILPLVHGIAGFVLVALAMAEMVTGWLILNKVLLK